MTRNMTASVMPLAETSSRFGRPDVGRARASSSHQRRCDREILHTRQSLSLRSIVYAMDGASFITTTDGTFVLIKPGSDFVPYLDIPQHEGHRDLIGDSMLDHVVSDDIRDFLEGVFQSLARGHQERVSYTFRDDTPSVERHCLAAVSALHQDGRIIGCLHQTVVIMEVPRRLMQLFSREKSFNPDRSPVDGHILPLCRFCHRVEFEGDFGRTIWISAEDYYIRGGTEDVTVDRVTCPGCKDTLMSKI